MLSPIYKLNEKNQSPKEINSCSKTNGTKTRRGRPPGKRNKPNTNGKIKSSPMLDKYLKNMGTPIKVSEIDLR